MYRVSHKKKEYLITYTVIIDSYITVVVILEIITVIISIEFILRIPNCIHGLCGKPD